MKRISYVVAGLVFSYGVPADAGRGSANSVSPCVVAVKVDVQSPLPLLSGEPLELKVRITNPGTSPIQLHQPSEETGSVGLLLRSDPASSAFKKYRGPMWGLLDNFQLSQTLAAGASRDLHLRVQHQVWREPFVFNASGTYQAKVVYQDPLACKPGLETPILEIKVAAPNGADLIVWNAIRDCIPCALFLHTGVVDFRPPDKDPVALLRSLVKQYPGSRYAKMFRKELKALDDRNKEREEKERDRDKEEPAK